MRWARWPAACISSRRSELSAFNRPVGERSRDVVAALASKPRRFTKDMLRHGLDYVKNRYDDQARSGDVNLPPALVAGQLAFQNSLMAPLR